jgi:hypothetical protein
MGRRMSYDAWLEGVVAKHGSKYDYSQVQYENSRSVVRIICPNHGPFFQQASSHTQGRGCRECSVDSRTKYSWEDFPLLQIEIDLSKDIGFTNRGKPCSILDLPVGTSKKLPWKCSICEHEWTATGNIRVSKGSGCPACTNTKIHSDGRNSMRNTHPHLAIELLPNDYGNADSLIAGTARKLPWKCSTCQHEWETTGDSRAGNGTGCPACTGKAVHIDGRNSLGQTHSELALELQPNKHGNAETLIAGTNKKLPWKCSICSHEWEASGSDRAGKRERGCPFCAGFAIHTDGRNSMRTTHPNLAEELLPNEFGNADTLIAGTYFMLPWKCSSCSHEWKASGENRTRQNSGCPPCAHRYLSSIQLICEIEKSMFTTHPKMARELLPNKYGNAKNLRAGTNKKLPWKCEDCGHEWVTVGSSRAKGSNCSVCADYGFHPNKPAFYYVFEILNEFGDRIFFKSGISNDWKGRMKRIGQSLPPNQEIKHVEHQHFELGQKAYDFEKMMLAVEEIRAPKRDFDGGSELFLYNPIKWAKENGVLFENI